LFAVVKNSRFYFYFYLAGKSVAQAAALVPKTKQSKKFYGITRSSAEFPFPFKLHVMVNKFGTLQMIPYF